MYWLDEVKARMKRGNKILFSKGCELLLPLAADLEDTEHRAAVLWALEFAQQIANELGQRYPVCLRPQLAVLAAREWAAGRMKMREAQRRILDCHAAAKELDTAADAALCHAIGQGCAVVHTAGHALGLPMYELSALVYRLGADNCAAAVEARAGEYLTRLRWWKRHAQEYRGTWAAFLER